VVDVVLLCPGQGAQRVGMGKDVAEAFPAARAVFQEADDVLGIALSRLMWDGPEDDLTLTHHAQPAILVHSLAVFAVVRDAVRPVGAAGHSLGEYAAYAAAKSLSNADASRLVRRRGELMLEAGRERRGTMTAVLGLSAQTVEELCRAGSRPGSEVVAANINAPDQTVISGDPEAVERVAALCKERGAKRVLPLKVSGAFHSPLMAPARRGLEHELARVAFADPDFPVIANATAEPVTSAVDARRLLGEQLNSPVQWVASMERAATLAGNDTRFVEIGPGKVLSGLLKRILPGAQATSLSGAGDIHDFLEGAG